MRNFRNLANQKYESIKFDFMFSKYKIEFVDTLVYKDKNNILQTTLFKKNNLLSKLFTAKIDIPVFALKELLINKL